MLFLSNGQHGFFLTTRNQNLTQPKTQGACPCSFQDNVIPPPSQKVTKESQTYANHHKCLLLVPHNGPVLALYWASGLVLILLWKTEAR